jgi:hypothetical protein
MRSFKICPAGGLTVVGRCRTPSGRFSGSNGVSSFFGGALSLALLVATNLELLAYRVRRKHLKRSGWKRHLRIGHGENIDIFEELIFVAAVDEPIT